MKSAAWVSCFLLVICQSDMELHVGVVRAYVEEAVVVVLVVVAVRGDVDVVDPDVVGVFYLNSVGEPKWEVWGLTYGHQWHLHWQQGPWKYPSSESQRLKLP